MADFVVQNLTDGPIPVYYLDPELSQQNTVLNPKETRTITADSLSPETFRLRTDGYIKINPFSGGAHSTPPNLPFLNKGMSYVGTWGVGVRFTPANVVRYAGSYYLVKQEVTGLTPPDTDTTNYAVFSISSPENFFGIPQGTFALGEGIFSDGASGWVNTKVTDAQVDAIGIAKITNLQTTLDAKLALTGGGLTGFVTLHADPTASSHAATKQYADTKLALTGGTMTGDITLPGNPTAALHAASKQYVDTFGGAFVATAGGTMTGFLTLHANPTAANHAANKTYVDARMLRAGDTMTGALALSGDPTTNLHAATKQYVDTMTPLAGGTMTGFLHLSGNPTLGAHAANKTYTDTQDALKLSTAGGTLTGHVLQSSAPTAGDHLVNKTYTDAQDNTKLNLVGGTMTGFITLSAAPTADLHAATKKYVDDNVTGAGGGFFLPYTGGAMTGAITGSHGLLPLTGGTMTGAVVLADLTDDDGGSPRDGIYNSTDTGKLSHNGVVLAVVGSEVETAIDYTVATDVGLVKVTGTGITTITLDDPLLYAGEVTVTKAATTPFNPVIVRFTGGLGKYAEFTLSDFRQSVTLRPTATAWEISRSFIPTTTTLSMSWGDPGVETAEAISISGVLKDKASVVKNFTAVTDETGKIGLTVLAGVEADFTVGDDVVINGTASYNGTHRILSTASGKIVVAGTFVATEAGVISAVVYRARTEAATFMVGISGLVSDPYNGAPAGITFEVTSGVELFNDGSIAVVRTDSVGAFTLLATDASAQTTEAYFHHLSAGGSFGHVEGERITAVSGALRYQATVTAMTQDVGTSLLTAVRPYSDYDIGAAITDATADGGGVWVPIAAPTEYHVGTGKAGILNSTSYTGEFDVLEVDIPGLRVRLDVAYTADDTGDVYSLTKSITFGGVDDPGDGLTIWLTGLSSFVTDMGLNEIVIASSTNYDGTHTVTEIDTDTGRVRVDTPYIATDAGGAYYPWAALFFDVTATEGDRFRVGETVEITTSLSYDGLWEIIGITGDVLMVKNAGGFLDSDSGQIANKSIVLQLSTDAVEFEVGHFVSIIGSTSHDGDYLVTAVDLGTDKVTVTGVYTAPDSGILRSQVVIELALANANLFDVEDAVRTIGVTRLNTQEINYSRIVSVGTDVIRVESPFDGAGSEVGTTEHAASKRLIWV